MAKRKKKRHPQARTPLTVPRRPMGSASAELMREFTRELDTLASTFNTVSQSLRSRYATRIADLDGIKLEEGWKLDGAKYEWVKPQ